jgi:hypothetical protein
LLFEFVRIDADKTQKALIERAGIFVRSVLTPPEVALPAGMRGRDVPLSGRGLRQGRCVKSGA